MSANCLPVPALICALHSTHNLNLNGHYVISNSKLCILEQQYGAQRVAFCPAALSKICKQRMSAPYAPIHQPSG